LTGACEIKKGGKKSASKRKRPAVTSRRQGMRGRGTSRWAQIKRGGKSRRFFSLYGGLSHSMGDQRALKEESWVGCKRGDELPGDCAASPESLGRLGTRGSMLGILGNSGWEKALGWNTEWRKGESSVSRFIFRRLKTGSRGSRKKKSVRYIGNKKGGAP